LQYSESPRKKGKEQKNKSLPWFIIIWLSSPKWGESSRILLRAQEAVLGEGNRTETLKEERRTQGRARGREGKKG